MAFPIAIGVLYIGKTMMRIKNQIREDEMKRPRE